MASAIGSDAVSHFSPPANAEGLGRTMPAMLTHVGAVGCGLAQKQKSAVTAVILPSKDD